VCTRTHKHTRALTHTCTQTYTNIFHAPSCAHQQWHLLCVCKCTHRHTHTRTHKHTHAPTHTHTRAQTHTHRHIHTHLPHTSLCPSAIASSKSPQTCGSVCVCVCVYVRVYVLIHVTQACIVPISQKETKNHAAKTDIHTRACYVQS